MKKIILKILSYILLLFIFSIFFIYLYSIYSLLNGLLFIITSNEIISIYFASFFILIISFLFSGEKTKKVLEKTILRLTNYNKRHSFIGYYLKGTPFFLTIFLNLPKRTLIYSFYLFILIYNQLHSLIPNIDIAGMVSMGFNTFIKANEFTIVLLIALDRIITNYKNEKSNAWSLKEKSSETAKHED